MRGRSVRPSRDVRPRGGLRRRRFDRRVLETSLLNLVINARDAMPAGGKLNIATRQRHDSNPTISGRAKAWRPRLRPHRCQRTAARAMTEEVRARAFDPFFTTKGIGKGTGLGLSMVYASSSSPAAISS